MQTKRFSCATVQEKAPKLTDSQYLELLKDLDDGWSKRKILAIENCNTRLVEILESEARRNAKTVTKRRKVDGQEKVHLVE